VENGTEKRPEDAIDAVYLLRKCYIEVSKAKEAKEKVRTDDGTGGMTAPTGTRKTGTNDEIFADMKKDRSWLEEPIKQVV
jgi:hypothetical protein